MYYFEFKGPTFGNMDSNPTPFSQISITTQCLLLTRHCYSNDTTLWDTVKCGPNVVKIRRCPAMIGKGGCSLEGRVVKRRTMTSGQGEKNKRKKKRHCHREFPEEIISWLQ
ncbi:hypothetical protein CDAR_484541 [Caerostris darwini]|uniref:Uncharacterized protein n=1 Tax=Caerostris darwini TaxID=1538125 RepID=A0AAV4MIL3_9ARAC|nr:hypothetical protein CDAR_484541 [Caerostris darwini]